MNLNNKLTIKHRLGGGAVSISISASIGFLRGS